MFSADNYRTAPKRSTEAPPMRVVVLRYLTHIDELRAIIGQRFGRARVDGAHTCELLSRFGDRVGDAAHLIKADRRELSS